MGTSVKDENKKMDLQDTPDDKKHMQREEFTIDLPDVKDIPGQEHVRPLPLGEMRDTTISSADEEGKGILDTEEDELNDQSESNVTPEEKELLASSDSSMATEDDQALKRAKVDNVDEDGEALNEEVDQSGADLDVPGSDDDDELEESGEGDEENNSYSLNDDKEDDVNTRQ